MLKILPALFFSLICFVGQTQIIRIDSASHWRKSLKAALNLNQASFSSNWKSGGVNSLGFNGLFNYKANYKADRLSWDNEIDMLYGMVNNAGQGFRKTLDRLYLDTKLGKDLNPKWGMFAAMNFLSQFGPGYKYETDANGVERGTLISSFLAPGFLTTSLGFEYHPASILNFAYLPLPHDSLLFEMSKIIRLLIRLHPMVLNLVNRSVMNGWHFKCWLNTIRIFRQT